ncbi:MarR family winged helix-turn-helix transcriptional regulator [Actinomadura rugatobispora]|uniref:MarR family winged helix-turn-helix transcriptional regulator n=1 Tax=Actinomadura rugatobispora TaxID=1994 RepID=A0ABW1ABR1_9ACTN
MPLEPDHLTPDEGLTWRSHLRVHALLSAGLARRLARDSGLSGADFEILAALATSPDGRMTSLRVRRTLVWEKSRLSHQVRRMEQRGLIVREPNPDDARSSLLALTPAGRATVEDAFAPYAQYVREHYLDLLTPEERDVLIKVSERVVAGLGSIDDA